MKVRPLAGQAEYLACVALQRRVWGEDFNETVSPALLWVAQHTGGVASGAFNAEGELVGFIFGITAVRAGEPSHWSDMMGVHPQWRGRGVGRALKLHQREQLLTRGIRVAQWTFEPLESRNAYLNFTRLGITAREYVRDAYGASASPLHAGIGTDRLIAHWQLDSERVRARLTGTLPGSPGAPAVAVNDVAFEGTALRSSEPVLGLDAPELLLRIPADIQALKAHAPACAREWRAHVRSALEHYLARGYEVRELYRENEAVSGYTLSFLRADFTS